MKRWTIAVVWALSLAGCSSQEGPEPVLGEAFVGPASLQVRNELAARAGLVATLKHGERLDIIGKRRRFYKVRTDGGLEGWVDGRQLLSPGNMQALKELAERAKSAPSQGSATVFESLNVHTEANRQSPSFFQITPESRADVIAHERAPRVPFEPPEFIQNTKAAKPARKAGAKKPPAVPPPPPGRAPSLPAGWMEMSRRPDGLAAPQISKPSSEAPKAAPAIPEDEWTLIRARDGRAGWVLSRMLLMAIPDEVAQYAERARIAAYFLLGTVQDGDAKKPVWMWATLSTRSANHQFDSLRIFTWSTRRHRYETSFIERNLKGYLPVRLSGEPGQGANGFRVVVEEKSGAKVEREYALQSYRARVVARRAAAAEETWISRLPNGQMRPETPPPTEEGWGKRAKGLIEDLKARIKR